MSNLGALRSSVDTFLKNRSVLIVDSHPYLRSITRTILLQLGVKTTREISDGFEAVDAICTSDPCAMILDWGIRGMDAREVVRVVRTSGMVPNPKMPIIAIAAQANKSKVIEAKNLGIEHLLLRPLSPMLLGQHLFPALVKSNQLASGIEEDGLLTPQEAADVLQVSLSWLDKARTNGNGPPYLRAGRSARYCEVALAQWMEAQQRNSPSEQQSSKRKHKQA